MRVLCRHGHLAFFPKRPSEAARICQYYGIELVRSDEFYTFPLLAEAKSFSLAGLDYLGIPAIKTYAGYPWEVMRENGFVYDVNKEALVPKASIVSIGGPELSGFCYVWDSAILQPGVRNALGNQILSYDGELNVENFHLKVSEFSYE